MLPGPVMCRRVEAVEAIASAVAAVVGIELEMTYRQVYKRRTVLEEAAVPRRRAVVRPYFSPRVLLVMFDFPERHLAPSIHSLHDRDRWHRGYVLVEAVEKILTWAERGRPLSEQCRTPLWPNSGREESAPDLISPAVHRARRSNCRSGMLGIAWT